MSLQAPLLRLVPSFQLFLWPHVSSVNPSIPGCATPTARPGLQAGICSSRHPGSLSSQPQDHSGGRGCSRGDPNLNSPGLKRHKPFPWERQCLQKTSHSPSGVLQADPPSVLGHKRCSFPRAGLGDRLDWILLARCCGAGWFGLPGSADAVQQEQRRRLGKSATRSWTVYSIGREYNII